MESKHADAMIVSAFGRGHWLAAELASQGIRVTLLDVSHRLGRWSAEDWEGPFGYFRSEKFSPLQIERLIEEDEPSETPQGFTVWTQTGPVELKSSLTFHRLKTMGLADESHQYMVSYEASDLQKNEALRMQLDQKKFSENWLARLAHVYASTRMSNHLDSLRSSCPLNLTQPFYFRQATRPGFERSLNWVAKKNVRVIAKADLVDVAFRDMRVVEGLEVRAEQSGLMRADQVIWCLTSEETNFISDRLMKTIFPHGHMQAEWSWVRYRLRLSPQPEREVLPPHFVLIDDLETSWTHENFSIVRRTQLADHFDVWMCLPSLHRFQKQYLEERVLRWTKNLAKRLPGLDPVVVEFPQEHLYSYDEMGPSRSPVFSHEQLKEFEPRKLTNWHWEGPETWDHHSLDAVFASQRKTRDEVLAYKQKLDLKKEKKK